ncbi:NAD(P)-dependent oxidoreductase [Micromonosporaceae bacterium Da 78-11]
MSRIAVLGMGRMGTEMAARLLEEGHDLTVWSRSGAPAALVEAGATQAASPAEAVGGADVAITMLTDEAAVTQVLFGPAGAADAIAAETVYVDMSTIGPEAVARIRTRLAPSIRFVDAPVQGSTPKARSGELGILVGGSDADVVACRPALDSLGTVRHLGPLGTGAATKLVVNLALGTSFVMVAEALRLGDHYHLSPDAVLDALSGTVVGALVPRVRSRLADPAAPTQFSLGLASKDLGLVTPAGLADAGAVSGAHRLMAEAVEAGLGDADISAILTFVRE